MHLGNFFSQPLWKAAELGCPLLKTVLFLHACWKDQMCRTELLPLLLNSLPGMLCNQASLPSLSSNFSLALIGFFDWSGCIIKKQLDCCWVSLFYIYWRKPLGCWSVSFMLLFNYIEGRSSILDNLFWVLYFPGLRLVLVLIPFLHRSLHIVLDYLFFTVLPNPLLITQVLKYISQIILDILLYCLLT